MIKGYLGVVVSRSIFTRRFWFTFITNISRRFRQRRQSNHGRQRLRTGDRSQAPGRVAMASVLAAGAAQTQAENNLEEDGTTADSLATGGGDFDNVTVTSSGEITTTASGIAVTSSSTISNDVTNEGTLDADSHGILISNSSTVGGNPVRSKLTRRNHV